MKTPLIGIALTCICAAAQSKELIPALPDGARLALEEDWSSGKIDPQEWYALRKHWGQGNAGVVPENVSITTDDVGGKKVNVPPLHGKR